MSTKMLIRIDEILKEKFDKLTRMEGMTKSAKVREFIEVYVEENDISKFTKLNWDIF